MKKLRRVDADVEADGAGDHHRQQEALRGEHRNRRSHIGADEQPARRAREREPGALQDMGGLTNLNVHGGPQPLIHRKVRPIRRRVEAQ